MPVSALRPKLNELQALGICEIANDLPPGLEANDYDGRANYYRIHPDWSRAVGIYRGAIRVGGRLVRDNIGKSAKEPQNELILHTPPNSSSIVCDQGGGESRPDHAETVSAIRNVIIARRDTSCPRGHFIDLIAATVRRQHTQLTGRDIEREIEHLSETDHEIQLILAGHPEGA
jgi:hypothetical protein